MINVLDHGFVRLVSYMQPAKPDVKLVDGEWEDSWTGDLEIVRNARASYDTDWRTGDDSGKDEKLVNYLYKNKHTSPFEAMVFTFEIKAPIFVIRQWHRHRTWSYNEVSARYTELPEEFYVPPALYEQGQGNKQMSADKVITSNEMFLKEMEYQNTQAFNLYHCMLKAGVSRELARTVLPLSTYSRFFGTVNLHNLFKFCSLRLHPHAQAEIQVYARALLDLVKPICPIAVQAFEEN